MAEELSIGTFEQIATIASRLATNYSNLAGTFYDVFYNPTPKDVTFQMVDLDGNVADYTVENLAKSNLYRKAGNDNPENQVAAVKGTIYQDLENGEAYIKKTADGNQGWFQLVTKALLDGYIIQGNVNPNGELVDGEYVGTVSAPAGTLYIDVTTTTLYIRLSSPDSGKYWNAISANTSGFAEIDLGNVSTVTGDGKTAITNLTNSILADQTASTITQGSSFYPTSDAVYNYVGTAKQDIQSLTNRVGTLEGNLGTVSNNVNNLSNTVAALGTSKQDKSNLVTSLSASSTDSQYPSAKCVYDLLGDVEALINAL